MSELKSARELSRSRPEIARLFEHLERTSSAYTIKGMYVSGLHETLEMRGIRRSAPRLHAFKDYPLRDYMELLLDAAATLYPTQPIRDGLIHLGRQAIPTFAASIVGGVIMGTVGRSWDLALKCVSKGYQVSLRPGSASVENSRPGHVVLQLRDVWNFPDSYQVGVVEGLMEWCGLRGQVTPRSLSACDVDLEIGWSVTTRRSQPPAGRASGGRRSQPPSASAAR